MPTDPDAGEYRRRARELRRLAGRLVDVPLAEIEGWAGPDTWASPGADDCRSMLSRCRQRLTHAVDDLRHRSIQFERHADTLDAAAALAAARLPLAM